MLMPVPERESVRSWRVSGERLFDALNKEKIGSISHTLINTLKRTKFDELD